MRLLLEKLRRWPALRLTFGVALLALAIGVTARPVEAQLRVELSLRFGYDTPPLNGPVVCRGNVYKILAQVVPFQDRIPTYEDSTINVESARNPIDPYHVDRRAHDPAAIFYYNAKDAGDETLLFSGGMVDRAPFQDGTIDVRTIPFPQTTFTFKVVDCQYKVSMIVAWHYSGGGVYFGANAYMGDTRIERKPDGTFEGNGPLDFEQIASLGICSADYSGFNSPTHITGKLRDDTGELELNFQYGQARSTATFVCPGVTAMGSHNEDVTSYLGVSRATFPPGGGVKRYSLPGQGQGSLTISVQPESAGN